MDYQQQLAIVYRIGGLLYKYLNQDISDDELTELHTWTYSDKANQELFEEITNSEGLQESMRHLLEFDKEAAFRSIQDKLVLQKEKIVPLPVNRWRYLVAAATIAALVAGMAVLYVRFHGRPDNNQPQAFQPSKNDAAPGGNKAVLTLANGNTIVLDNAKDGMLTQQGNTKVLKLASGQLEYTADSQASGSISYNILSTPRGGQYRVVLPDGSKVWLNAASSLKYPTAFTGKEREVELTGEAYFEVAKNAAMPFKVKLNDMAVNVLATSFNIMAYNEEGAKQTTLLTGAVKVSHGGANNLLKPGDQAQLGPGGKFKVISDVDVDNVLAWKNGYFYFDRADIKTVLRQLARWYDVQVEYQGTIPTQHFGGKIQRDLRLSQVLEILETNQVHFTIEGKKLTVLP